MKKILVEKEVEDARLTSAILVTLREEGVIGDSLDMAEIGITTKRKNDRANGKYFCIISDLLSGENLFFFWMEDIYRYNYYQRCTLRPITDTELDKIHNID